MRRAARVAIALVVIVLGLAVAAFVAAGQFQQYGAPRTPLSVAEWAGRVPIYAVSLCARCHDGSAGAGTAHDVVRCEACHTPVVEHPGNVAGTVQALPISDSTTCVACHARVAGRPVGFPQVQPSAHFSAVACLRCHDPHTAAAVAPPEVTHPLVDLPPCTTCHSLSGLKRYPEGHQAAADNVCLACHLPDRREP